MWRMDVKQGFKQTEVNVVSNMTGYSASYASDKNCEDKTHRFRCFVIMNLTDVRMYTFVQ